MAITIKRPIGLTSPYSRGKNVAHVQTLLKNNRFKQHYYTGKVDSIYGPDTMRATKRAKYWMGYPDSALTGKYGPTLDAYLSGRKHLPEVLLNRRAQRLKASAAVPLRVQALRRAITQIGVTESPRGSNNNPYGRWYGVNYAPWCACFATWCYVNEGSKGFKRGARYSFVPWIVQDGRRGLNGMSITHSPQPGDLVCFDWRHDGQADHVGLYEKNLGGGNFTSIEGNTGEGNDSNGGEVMRRNRNTSSVQAFVHCAR